MTIIPGAGGRNHEKRMNLIEACLHADSIGHMVQILEDFSGEIERDMNHVEHLSPAHAIGAGLAAVIVTSYEMGLHHGRVDTPIIFKEDLQRAIDEENEKRRKKQEGDNE